jgi:hypothetical protein
LVLSSLFSIDIKDENGEPVSDTLYICDDCYHRLQKFLAGEDDKDFDDNDGWEW